MKKDLGTVRLELGNYFNGGSNFYDWEKEFGILNTSITRTEDEAIAYYEKVIDVIKAVFETLSWSERTDIIVRIINKYVRYNYYDKVEIQNIFFDYNQQKVDFEAEFDDLFIDDLYNELLDAVVQDRNNLLKYQSVEVEDNSSVKGEEFNKILNSLPLYKILMEKIVKELF